MSKRAFAIFAMIWVFLALPLMEFIGANEGWKAVAKPLLLQPTYPRDVIFAALFYLPLIACSIIWWRTSRTSNAAD